jgi:hypothetical protein
VALPTSAQQWGTSERFRELNQNGVDFVLIDLDVGMTFMDVAEASRIDEITRRNHHNARKAYDAVVRLLEKLKPSLSERQAIDAKLAILRTRLQTVGQQF